MAPGYSSPGDADHLGKNRGITLPTIVVLGSDQDETRLDRLRAHRPKLKFPSRGDGYLA